MKYLLFVMGGAVVWIGYKIFSMFTREGSGGKFMEKEIKNAQKSNDRAVKSGRKFLQNRTKYKERKL